MTAARPDPFKVKVQRPDGTSSISWERPAPVIEPLKKRILEVLEHEGKALVALNTLLFAGDLHEGIVAHKVRIRDDAANRLIWNFALAKGATVALNPIPVADMAGGLAVDVGMIVALSKVYGIPLTRRTAVILIKDMVRAMGALGAVEITGRLMVMGVRTLLAGTTIATGGLAAPLSALGYGAISLSYGVTASWASYVLGRAAKVYLQQGCQWGTLGIKTVIQQILMQAKTDSVVERLRDDLRRKVGTERPGPRGGRLRDHQRGQVEPDQRPGRPGRTARRADRGDDGGGGPGRLAGCEEGMPEALASSVARSPRPSPTGGRGPDRRDW